MTIMKNKSVKQDEPNYFLLTAWIVMLLASSLALIIWREFISTEPIWWPWLHFASLLIILLISCFSKSLRPLRSFVMINFIIFFLGFGGGWQWGIIPFIRSTPMWLNWEANVPWAISSIMTHLLRLLPAVVILMYLLGIGRKRKDFFLVKGEINALIEPTKLLGIKEPEPWPKTALIFIGVYCAGMLIFLIFNSSYSLDTFLLALPLFPVSILIAAMNAFNEEFTLRAAPLSELRTTIGDQRALLITTLYFGLGHYYGIPNGILGVLLACFLGWFLGKNMLETKGFFWAWITHFLIDVIIFSFLAMDIVA